MKAVIMAGGEGSRLRPLTCDLPKPMSRLLGRPTLEYILDLLKKSGIDSAAVTVKYLPQNIMEHFPDLDYNGMKLWFFEEDKPLGTAGSVKNASSILTEDFIVISGDALCDVDIAGAIKFHKEKNAAATLILSHVSDPREYGLVVTAADGSVVRFVEKPGWGQAITDAVNTGIYIISPDCLKLIPDDKSFDFAQDLFPLMMKNNMTLFGFDSGGYWCDIGDIPTYLSCQFDMLEGKVDCEIKANRVDGIYYKGKPPVGEFQLIPPSYIGEGVKIGDGSVIGPFAIIDDGCAIGAVSTIKSSIMLPGSFVGDKAELRGALLCCEASVKSGAAMFEGSVAGSNALIGTNAAVSPGVRIWPNKRVEAGVRAAENIKFGSARYEYFDDDGISGEAGVELSPEFCARVGASIGSTFPIGKIGIASNGTNSSLLYKKALSSGILSTGAESWDFGTVWDSLFGYAVAFCSLDCGIYVGGVAGKSNLRLIGPSGLPLGRSKERKIEACLSRGEFSRCSWNDIKQEVNLPTMQLIYKQELLRTAPNGLKGMTVDVKCSRPDMTKLMEEVLTQLEYKRGDTLRLHIGDSGKFLAGFDEDGKFISQQKMLAISCLIEFMNGNDVAVSSDAPRIIDTLAKKYNKQVLRYLECSADNSDEASRKLALTQIFVRDGLFAAIRLLSFLHTNRMTLAHLSNEVPHFAIVGKKCTVTTNTGSLVKGLTKNVQNNSAGEGVIIPSKSGDVLVRPFKRGGGFRILAESYSIEAAEELCADLEKKLQENQI